MCLVYSKEQKVQCVSDSDGHHLDCFKLIIIFFKKRFCSASLEVNDNGLPFWSGSKRCPHPLTFDPNSVSSFLQSYVHAKDSRQGEHQNPSLLDDEHKFLLYLAAF